MTMLAKASAELNWLDAKHDSYSPVRAGITNLSLDIASRKLQSRNTLVCPNGLEDQTRGRAIFWACGRGCPGGYWVNACCQCACAREPHRECKTKPPSETAAQSITTTSVLSRASYVMPASSRSEETNQVLDHEEEDDHDSGVNFLPTWIIVIIAIMGLGCIIMGIAANGAKRSRVKPAPDDIESQTPQGKVTQVTAQSERFTTEPPPYCGPRVPHTGKLAVASQASPRPSDGSTLAPSSRPSLRSSSSIRSPRQIDPPHRLQIPRSGDERSRSLPSRPRDSAGKDGKKPSRSFSPVSSQSRGSGALNAYQA